MSGTRSAADAPSAPTAPSAVPPPRHCANCDAPLLGPYCGQCGQKDTDIAVSLRTLAHDFADEYFSLDSRLLRSVGYLFFRPGFLTRQYVIGRRERYVRPLRLYLVSSIAFFFAFSLLFRPGVDMDAAESASLRELISGAAAESASEGAAAAADTAPAAVQPPPSVPRVSDFTVFGQTLPLEERMERIGQMTPRALFTTLSAGFERYLPRMMFVLLPVFALLLKLLYVRRHWYYAEHFVFTLHFHAFAFTLFLLLLVLPSGGWSELLTLWGAVYLFWAMYRVYKQSLMKTAVKYFLLTGAYSVLLGGALATSVVFSLLLV